MGAPYLARFLRDVGYREALFVVSTEPKNGEDGAVESHISQKTSEMWGTHRSFVRTESPGHNLMGNLSYAS